jgi:hypothetical protein
MPATFDSTDYDLFDFKHFDDKPLTLEEACRKAAEMRQDAQGMVYRVTPVDREMTAFRVDAVSLDEVYASFRHRANIRLARLMRRQK